MDAVQEWESLVSKFQLICSHCGGNLVTPWMPYPCVADNARLSTPESEKVKYKKIQDGIKDKNVVVDNNIIKGERVNKKRKVVFDDEDQLSETNRFNPNRPIPESLTRTILELQHSSRIGFLSMEDVLMDQLDGADLDSSPLAGLCEKDVLRWYKNLKKFTYVVDHADHFFSARDNQLPEEWAGKIHQELRILEEQLPETIYVRAYKSRMDLLRAVIIGPDGTPYHGGLFFFDLCFPSNYPYRPPLLHYRSGGMGINPNLFNCGKVRLNLPSKSGGLESMWVPGTTTILQLLVSIQNQILKADPLFNEPAYATMKSFSVKAYASFLYNEAAFIESLKTMLYTMNKPPKNFEEFVVGHFRIRARDILLLAWNKKPYTSTFLKAFRALIKPLLAAFNKTRPKEEKIVLREKEEKSSVSPSNMK